MAKSDTVHALIIDDDRSIQRILAEHLARLGFSVAVERDGEWACKTFEKRPFDVVILDLLLPGLSGYEVARRMRSMPKGKKTPIIMVSGVYKNALHKKEAVERHGAFAFHEKPVSLGELDKTLKAALGDRFPDAPKPEKPSQEVSPEKEKLADASAKEEVTEVEDAARNVGSVQTMRGDLKDKPFPELLAEIYRWRATGALLLRREKTKKIAYFKAGVPQFVKSNLLSECLGRVLVRERMISETDCAESLRRMKASSRQQGTVLIEMGCISPHNLVYALNLQLQTKLFDVFSWDSGEYQFSPKVSSPSETISLEMSTAAIIHEGVRRHYSEQKLRKAISDCDEHYPVASDNPLYALQDVGLGEEEQALLRAMDGKKSIGTLRALKIIPGVEFDRLVYAMKCAQVIQLLPKAQKGKPTISFPEMPAVKIAPVTIDELRNKADVPWFAPPAEIPPPPLPGEKKAAKNAVANAAKAPASSPSSTKQPSVAAGATATGPLLPELAWPKQSQNNETIERERLVAHVAAMRKQDYFEILGVPTTATKDQIQEAFIKLAKENHPDKHGHSASAEIRQLVEEIYQLLNTAHDTLVDATERQRYVARLKSGQRPEMSEDIGKILAAESKFQRGEELLTHEHFTDAFMCFQDAIRLYEDEGEFHAYLGWAQYRANPDNAMAVAAALRALTKAVALNPKSEKGYLFMGQIYKAQGKVKEAERQFEKAIQCNPGCVEALRELSILSYATSLKRR